jgi:hypothetical protein
VGPRTDLDVCEKSRPHRDTIPGPSSPKPVAIPTELPGPHHQEVEFICYIFFNFVMTNKHTTNTITVYRVFHDFMA